MMSSAGRSCPHCGSSNIVEDTFYANAQRVCEDCGSVLSEGGFVEQAEGKDISYRQSTEETKRSCINLIKGLYRVKALCRILRLNGEIQDLAQVYYRQAYEHHNFIKVSLQKKEVLVGCCVLVSCRRLNWPVTMDTIGCLLEADPMMVGLVYQEMVRTLGIEAPTFSIIAVLEAHVQEYKIGKLHVPEEFAEDSRDLTKRAVALVELAADTWILTGRKPFPIMMASVFIAWQSLKPFKIRLNFTLERFCQLAKVKKHNAALKRISEIKEVLCKLGQELPWLDAAVTQHNVMQQVEDILKHRFTLMQRALRTHEDALLVEEHQPSSGDILPGDPSEVASLEEEAAAAAPSQDLVLVEQTPKTSGVEACGPTARGAKQPGGGDLDACAMPKLHKGTVPQGSRAPAPYWGERVLFAPPCVKRRKIRSVESPAFQDVTGDEEISDSEIDSYIRTPQEVREFSLTKKMLDMSGDK